MKRLILSIAIIMVAMVVFAAADSIKTTGSSSVEYYLNLEAETSAGWVVDGDAQMGLITEYADIESTAESRYDITAMTLDGNFRTLTIYTGVRTNDSKKKTVTVKANALKGANTNETLTYGLKLGDGAAVSVSGDGTSVGLFHSDEVETSKLRQVWKPLVFSLDKGTIDLATADNYSATVTMTVTAE